MEISGADLELFDLAGNTGHTDSQGLACELSGNLCDLAEKSDPRPHWLKLNLFPLSIALMARPIKHLPTNWLSIDLISHAPVSPLPSAFPSLHMSFQHPPPLH